MRIPCSNCGRAVRVRVNDNGEINCPRCGAGLLVVASIGEKDGGRIEPALTLDPEGVLTTPRTSLVILLSAALLVALIAAALIVWLRF